MVLPLPGAALAVEGDVVEAHPGHVDGGELPPGLVALCGAHLRLLVDEVLEVVHHRAVGDEGQRAGQVRVAELARVRAEEILRPGPGKELHGHGVDLAGLKRGPLALARDNEAAGEVGEGVAGLVRDDLDVVRGAVEVGEDEGAVVAAEGGAVAAAGLALAGEDVQQLVVVHEVDELRRLGAELVVEAAPGGEDVVRRALGLRVAAAELQGVVRVVHGVGLAQALGLAAVDGVGQGDDVLHDGLSEALDVLLRVAVALHTVVAQGDVALVAELFAHRVAQAHQLVVDGV